MLTKYTETIKNQPIREQSFGTKRNHANWVTAETHYQWFKEFNEYYFLNLDEPFVSRQDLMDTNNFDREFIIKTIYWGYPNGMRGANFKNILFNIEAIEYALVNLKNIPNPVTKDFDEFAKCLKSIPGIGLSTYSKLLYFMGIKFNNCPSLILDLRLIKIFQKGIFKEYHQFQGIKYDNAVRNYINYLSVTNNLAIEMETQGENIEYFLFNYNRY